MKEITVTDAQAAKAPFYVEKWIKRMIRSDWDQQKAIEATKAFYSLIQEDEPKRIEICDGPKQVKELHGGMGLLERDLSPAPSNGALWCEWRALYDFVERECGYDLGIRPLLDLDESGAFFWWFYQKELAILCAPPQMRFDQGKVDGSEPYRLHCADGPAVRWKDGSVLFFYKGVAVPERIIADRASLRASDAMSEKNAEIRRIMVELIGAERFLRDGKFSMVQRDDYGKLWRKGMGDEEAIQIIEVVNSTPEVDGSFKTYHLFVPPTSRTCREAVAWSFRRERAADYEPMIET